MEINEALGLLRKQKDDPNSPGYFLYRVLADAHPTVRAMVERQCAHALLAGENIVNIINEQSKTEKGKKEIQKHIDSLKAKIASGMSKEPEEKEEEPDVG